MKVTQFNQALKKKTDQLVELMLKHRGIGLAATQVGWIEAIFCTHVYGRVEIFINPRKDMIFGKLVVADEGCLSFPGLIIPVARDERIAITFQDLTGESHTRIVYGLLARVCQHELDHLSGILITDHMAKS